MAVIAAAAATAGAQLAGDLSSRIADGVAGVFGDTRTDRERQARAASLLSRALAGDEAALVQLARDAFEPKRGLPGDDRPPDGKMSPADTRSLALQALRSYVAQRGGVPPALSQYAERIGAEVVVRTPGVGEFLENAIGQGVREGVARGAAERVQGEGAAFVDRYGALIALSIVAAVVVVAWRKS